MPLRGLQLQDFSDPFSHHPLCGKLFGLAITPVNSPFFRVLKPSFPMNGICGSPMRQKIIAPACHPSGADKKFLSFFRWKNAPENRQKTPLKFISFWKFNQFFIISY